MTQQQGTFTVPTRLFLTLEQRKRLELLIRERETELADLVSQIVADYLEAQPATTPPPEAPRDYGPEIQRYRVELNRLRKQQQDAGNNAPPWLAAYIAEIESEIRRLEAR
jgi:hypothetical protein